MVGVDLLIIQIGLVRGTVRLVTVGEQGGAVGNVDGIRGRGVVEANGFAGVGGGGVRGALEGGGGRDG